MLDDRIHDIITGHAKPDGCVRDRILKRFAADPDRFTHFLIPLYVMNIPTLFLTMRLFYEGAHFNEGKGKFLLASIQGNMMSVNLVNASGSLPFIRDTGFPILLYCES